MSLRFKRRNKRVSNSRCCTQALKLNHVCCCFTSASGLDSWFIRHTRLKDDIYPSCSLDRLSDVFVYLTSKVVGQTDWCRRSRAGLTRVGTGRRRRLLRPEPWRAGSKTWRYSEFAVCTVSTHNPSELASNHNTSI